MSDGCTTASGATIQQIANSTTERVMAAASPGCANAGPELVSAAQQLFCQGGATMGPAARHTCIHTPAREPDLQGPGTSSNPRFLSPQQESSRSPSVLQSPTQSSFQECHSLRLSQSADSMPGAPLLFTSADAVRLIPVGRPAARRS
ncbi:hypothetical protein NDU88_008444 [Pleurodeles waltl]|uniref:Uncharacterized protein n=1 Tax=Pleurodeles waltl TaxID=8319 RepID=A0AAV7PPC0_PLEWA|nr:hypothetical protein NDU88_008444 [Pleurodeles waltl]